MGPYMPSRTGPSSVGSSYGESTLGSVCSEAVVSCAEPGTQSVRSSVGMGTVEAVVASPVGVAWSVTDVPSSLMWTCEVAVSVSETRMAVSFR